MLFKYVLHTKAFISIRYMPILITLIVHHSTDVRLVYLYRRPFGVEQEFFVQLFVEHDPNLRLPTVGDLLRRMFLEQHISFTKVL